MKSQKCRQLHRNKKMTFYMSCLTKGEIPKIIVYNDIVPFKTIGMTRLIHLFLLYTKTIILIPITDEGVYILF